MSAELIPPLDQAKSEAFAQHMLAVLHKSILPTSSVFGNDWEEIQCLLRQSRRYNPCTQRLLKQACITAGMKVLEVGSGVGDVTFLAGELVGPSGMVVGVERDLALLEMARTRACAAGLTQVSFVAGDLGTLALARDFDAVIGRNVLLYLTDPVALLRVGAQHLRPGGMWPFTSSISASSSVCLQQQGLLPSLCRWYAG